MTERQRQFYWSLWAEVHRAQPALDRHELHRKALGYDKSSKDFNDREFDKIIGEFRAVSQPSNLHAQLRQAEQPRKRLIWRIKRMAPAAYTAEIARDKFHTAALTDLDESQLVMLRNTLASRSAKLRFGTQKDQVECPF